MSKYIRTKDGHIGRVFIESKNTVTCIWGDRLLESVDDIGDCIYKDDILKTADNLEELCDGFEVVRGRFNDSEEGRCISVQCETLEEAKSIAATCDIKYVKYEIFGFIWVDGDSIQVSKMNQKGEFILL